MTDGPVDGAAIVASLDGSGGLADRIGGSERDVWGLGVVQHIEAAAMQVYLGYRHHTAEFELLTSGGVDVPAAGIDDFDTLVTGAKIAF